MIYQAARWRRKPGGGAGGGGGDAEGGGAGMAMANGAANRGRDASPFIMDDSDMVRENNDEHCGWDRLPEYALPSYSECNFSAKYVPNKWSGKR